MTVNMTTKVSKAERFRLRGDKKKWDNDYLREALILRGVLGNLVSITQQVKQAALLAPSGYQQEISKILAALEKVGTKFEGWMQEDADEFGFQLSEDDDARHMGQYL